MNKLRLIFIVFLLGCSQSHEPEPELSFRNRVDLRQILERINNQPMYLADRDNRVEFRKWCAVTGRLIDRDYLIDRFNEVCREQKWKWRKK